MIATGVPVLEEFESHVVRSDSARHQADVLADVLALRLREAIADRGSASIAFSGGSTPALMLEQLARRNVDWSRVAITLVDERCVPETDERSNAGMLRKKLLDSLGMQPQFFPLYVPGEDLADRDARFDEVPLPFDVVHLGMGTDAHTASFFPDSENIEAMLDLGQPKRLMQTQSISSREVRLTWSLAALLESRFVVLQLIGTRKLAVLSQALEVLSLRNAVEEQLCRMPILSVLAQTQLADAGRVPVQIYFASE